MTRHVSSVISSARSTVLQVAITILTWKMLQVYEFMKRVKIIITIGRDCGLASWINKIRVANDPLA